ncbi:MAG: protein-L-isoaspartate O-methyltransferase family protein [Longimicrobiales bacterium]
MTTTVDFESARYRMIARDIVARDVKDRNVIAALASVHREAFVPPTFQHLAYSDPMALIGRGHYVSQPFVVAAMVQALRLEGGERVLEVGTECGYTAAVLSRIAGHVFTLEGDLSLAEAARVRFLEQGLDNVSVRFGTESQGLVGEGPYDAILISPGGPPVSEMLRAQLVTGGRLVSADGRVQPRTLTREVRRPDGGFSQTVLSLTSPPIVRS